jgi:hypothetical protein
LFTEREKRIYSLKPVHLDSGDQGDQIGEIFTYWSIVSTLKKYETDKDFSYLHISTVALPGYLHILTKKPGWATFWRFFHKVYPVTLQWTRVSLAFLLQWQYNSNPRLSSEFILPTQRQRDTIAQQLQF